jgi:hypothetical protein
LAGDDVTTLIDDNLNLIDTYGNNNSESYRIFLTSSADLLLELKENPTEADKVVIKQKLKDLTPTGQSIITSQIGMKHALTDTKLLAKPENREFNQILQGKEIMFKSINENPAKAYDFFIAKGDESANKLSHSVVVIEDFIKRNKIGK